MGKEIELEPIKGADNGASVPDKLSEAYPKINRSFESVKGAIEDTNAQIQSMVVQAGSGNTAIDAARRDGVTGVTFPTLGARLDNATTKIEAKANQSDLGNTNARLEIKADKAYVDTLLQALASGAPKGPYATLVALQTAFPTGASGIYLVTADGKWYFWSASAWTAGGTYQATGIADGSVTAVKLDPDLGKAIPESWEASSSDSAKIILYGIADKDGRAAFTVDENGVVGIDQLQLGKAPTLPDKSIAQTKLEGVELADDEVSGLLWGIVDSQGRQSELLVDQNGQVPKWVLDVWKERMDVQDTVFPVLPCIVCVGDSLTAGAGGNGTTYPSVLQTLSGLTVYNMGVGGENSATIVARQGGSTMMINILTIPAVKQNVQIFPVADTRFTDNMGNTGLSPLRQGTAGVNPCTISGIEGTLSIQQASSTSNDVVYFFNRTVSGAVETVINRPTPIITAAMKDRKKDIMVIFIGQNGGWNNDPATLTMQIRSMVDYSDNDQFIVIGLHTLDAASRATLEAEMLKQFGRRYINLRDYMTKYGLADAGITPTTQDTTDMASGKTPTSLMTDGTHFTAAGYTIIGNLIYKRMKELYIL